MRVERLGCGVVVGGVPVFLQGGEDGGGGKGVPTGWVGVSVGTGSIGGAPGGGVLADGVASGVGVVSAVRSGGDGGVVVGVGGGRWDWNGRLLLMVNLGSRG